MSQSENDPIRSHLTKIEKGLDEVKYRSISTIYSKVTNKVLSSEDLALKYPDMPSFFLNFINNYQTVASLEYIRKTLSILLAYSDSQAGAKIMNDYGAIEFCTQFREKIKQDKPTCEILDNLLQKLMIYKTTRSERLRMLYTLPDKALLKEKENATTLNISNISEIARLKSTQRDFGQSQAQPPAEFSQTGETGRTQGLSTTKKPIRAIISSNQRGISKPTAGVNIESEELNRLKQNKEDFFPFLIPYLDEQDQKFLFDVTAQLKYGDAKNAERCLKELMPAIFQDFPLEALFGQPELIQEILNQVRRNDPEIQSLALDLFITIFQGMLQTYNTIYLRENQNINENVASEEFLATQDRDFIVQAYPGLELEKLQSKEYVENQRNAQSAPTYFEIFDSILRSTFPIMSSSNFVDKIAKIWDMAIFILREFFPQKRDLVKEALKDYVRGFIKVLGEVESKVFTTIHHYFLIKIFWRLWKSLSVEDYAEIQGFNPVSGLEIMNKAALRYLIDEGEVEGVCDYMKALAPETEGKLRTSMSLLSAIKELQKFEDKGGRIRNDSIETFFENERLLAHLLVASPYSRHLQVFFDNYLTLTFFTTAVEYSEVNDCYQKCKTHLLRIMNIPQLDLRARFYEILLQNLHSDEYFLQSHTRKSLTSQLLLDAEFAKELIHCGLASEEIANILAKIMAGFINFAVKHDLPISNYAHIVSFLPLFYCLAKASPSNLAAPCKVMKDAIAHIDSICTLRIVLLDLFSHNASERRAAFRHLATKIVFEDMLSKELDLKVFIERYNHPSITLSEADYDPLSLFIDKDGKFTPQPDLETVAFEYTKAKPLDYKMWADGSLEALYNLLGVVKNSELEHHLRLSAVDQLCEYLGLLFKEKKVLEEEEDVKVYIQELLNYIFGTLEGYAKSEVLEKADPDRSLAAKLLGLVTALTHLSKRLPYVAETLGVYLNLYDNRSHFLITLAVNFLHSKSNICVYQALKLLSLFAFITPNPSEYRLNVDPRVEESFYLMNNFSKVPNSFSEAKFWSIYPLEDGLRYFVEKFLEVSHPNSRNRSFDPRERALEEKSSVLTEGLLDDLSRTHGAGDILSVLEEWKRVVDTFGEVLPAPLSDFPFLTSAVKAMRLTLAAFNFSGSVLEQTSQLISSVLNHPGFLNEINYNPRVFEDVLGLLEFLTSQIIPVALEIPPDHAREKMDLINSMLLLLTKLIALTEKIRDPKYKHVVFKKMFKQNLLDLLGKLVQFFYNNEEFLFKVAKLVNEIIEHPEIYLVYDLFPVINALMDFLLNFKPTPSFRTKCLTKTLFNLFLDYTRIDESFRTKNLQVTQQSLQQSQPLSGSLKSNIVKTSTFGWLLKMTEDRETKIRALAWNQLANILDKHSLLNYGSSIDTALNVIYSPNEAYAVISAALHFLNNVLTLHAIEGEFEPGSLLKASQAEEQDSARNAEEEGTIRFQEETISDIEIILYRRNIIAHIKNLLLKKNAPPLYYGCLFCKTLVILLLRNVTALNRRKSLPILNQLEIWDTLIEIYSERQWRKRHNGRVLYQYEQFQTLMAMNNLIQFLLFAVSSDPKIADYLINCTGVLRSSLRWLSFASQLYKDAASTSPKVSSETRLFVLDGFNENLVKFIHLLVFLNEEKSVLMINKFFEEKFPITMEETHDGHRKHNVFYLLTEILNSTKRYSLILSIFKLMGMLVPKWPKGLKFINYSDMNNESVADNLILICYTQYRLNEELFSEGKLSQDDYLEAKSGILSYCSAVLYGSNISKNAMISSGFLAMILSEFIETSESLLLEDTKASTRTVGSTSVAQSESTLSAGTKTFKKTTLIVPRDHFLLYLRVLKHFFIEEAGVTKGVLDKTAHINMQKLHTVGPLILEAFNRGWKVAVRREDYLQEFLLTLTNFASNTDMNSLLFNKLIDNKLAFFNEILAIAQRFDNAELWQFALILRHLCSFTHSSEFRNFIYRSKILELSCAKIIKIWNLRKEFNLQNPIIVCFLHFYLSLSFYKDSLTRILHDKQLLDILIDLAELVEFRGTFAESVLTLLANLAYHKSNKAHFISNEEIFAIFLAIINNESNAFKLRVIASQFFANVIYKSAEAVALLDKEHIVNQFFFLRKEMEKEVDKVTLLAEKESIQDQEKLKLTKLFLENLNKINLVFKGVVLSGN